MVQKINWTSILELILGDSSSNLCGKYYNAVVNEYCRINKSMDGELVMTLHSY